MSFVKALIELTTVYDQKLYVDPDIITNASTGKPELNEGEPCTLLTFYGKDEPALVKGEVRQILWDSAIEWVAVPRVAPKKVERAVKHRTILDVVLEENASFEKLKAKE